jgi:hypothetical protein
VRASHGDRERVGFVGGKRSLPGSGLDQDVVPRPKQVGEDSASYQDKSTQGDRDMKTITILICQNDEHDETDQDFGGIDIEVQDAEKIREKVGKIKDAIADAVSDIDGLEVQCRFN